MKTQSTEPTRRRALVDALIDYAQELGWTRERTMEALEAIGPRVYREEEEIVYARMYRSEPKTCRQCGAKIN